MAIIEFPPQDIDPGTDPLQALFDHARDCAAAAYRLSKVTPETETMRILLQNVYRLGGEFQSAMIELTGGSGDNSQVVTLTKTMATVQMVMLILRDDDDLGAHAKQELETLIEAAEEAMNLFHTMLRAFGAFEDDDDEEEEELPPTPPPTRGRRR